MAGRLSGAEPVAGHVLLMFCTAQLLGLSVQDWPYRWGWDQLCSCPLCSHVKGTEAVPACTLQLRFSLFSAATTRSSFAKTMGVLAVALQGRMEVEV